MEKSAPRTVFYRGMHTHTRPEASRQQSIGDHLRPSSTGLATTVGALHVLSVLQLCKTTGQIPEAALQGFGKNIPGRSEVETTFSFA